jgi:hypothetical protein
MEFRYVSVRTSSFSISCGGRKGEAVSVLEAPTRTQVDHHPANSSRTAKMSLARTTENTTEQLHCKLFQTTCACKVPKKIASYHQKRNSRPALESFNALIYQRAEGKISTKQSKRFKLDVKELSRACYQRRYFFSVLGFELRAYTVSHFTSPFLVKGFSEIRSHKLFAPAGFEPRST